MTHRDVTEITAQELDIVPDAGEIGFVPRAEIVYHPNAVPESNEPRGKMRTDETGAARYQAR